MNKNVYRIVFNKARRMYMVASENTHAKGKGDTVTTNHIAQLFIGLGLGYLTTLQAQGAGIVADSAAPSNQRPIILNAGNNVPLVNIQTPSAAGVSRNTYSQFDVGTQGAILNNSRADTQTQLGGYVQANPYLATGAARVILNEVNSNNPSLLQGYVEVAGSRAQVVIANPSGITCDGCGFINTTRTTLTTGSPNMLGGNLDSYRVERGTVTVQGRGLDTSTADYTDIITRAVNVNAGIWANTLKVTTGVNTVNADNNQATMITGVAASAAPSFAIDVAALGGMYAGKIMMIGTETGVGVRNAGTIGASAGELSLDISGNLTTTHYLGASGSVAIRAQQVTNSGQIQTNQSLTLTTQGDITNHSKILAGQTLTISANNLNNTNRAELGGANTLLNVNNTIDNLGLIDGGNTFIQANAISNHGTGNIFGNYLAIATNELINKGEGSQAGVIAARNRLDIGAQTITNQEGALIFSAGNMAIGGNLDISHQATGQANTLNNTSATIESLGDIYLNVAQINNTNTHLSTQYVRTSTSSTLAESVDVRANISSPAPASGNLRQYQLSHPTGGGALSFGRIYNHDEIDHFYLDNNGFVHIVIKANVPNDGVTDSAYFTQYNSGTIVYETRVLDSKPGQILAGRNIQVNANAILNSDSKIIAGETFNAYVSTLNNQETLGTRSTQYSEESAFFRTRESCDCSRYFQYPNYPAPTIESINLGASGYGAVSTVTGTGTSITGFANNSNLYQPTANPNVHYLVETNPRFTDYRSWLSSDYILNALSYDPAATQKRLGDGFYEQRLIREQIAQLTGRRFLSNYSDDEAQYQSLMTNGATFAQAHQLTLGATLSAEQVAQLTSDIVWLISQTVTLADGSQVQALVPHVYMAAQSASLTLSGSLISGNTLNLQATQNVINSGDLVGHESLSINADAINNLNGRIRANTTTLTATQDINNLGGQIRAQDSLRLTAGRDINIQSTTANSALTFDLQQNNKRVHVNNTNTNIDRVASLYIDNPNGAGSLVASSGNNLNLSAAEITNLSTTNTGTTNSSSASNQTYLNANNQINICSISTAQNNSYVKDAKNYNKSSSNTAIGSKLQVTGNLALTSTHGVNINASQLQSDQGKISVSTQGDINITSATNTYDSASAAYKKSSGFLSSSKKTTLNSSHDTQTVNSTLSADSISLSAGDGSYSSSNINLQAANVVASHDVNLNATGNINVESAINTHQETHLKAIKKTGFSSSGTRVGFGTSKLNTSDTSQSVTNIASTLGSVNGNLNIIAGNTYNQTGSDVLTPQGDINITAKDVNIQAATNTSEYTQKMDYKQTGITIGLSSSALNLAQSVASTTQAAVTSDSSRNKALNALQTYANASTLSKQGAAAVDAIKAGDAQGAVDAAGIRLSVSIGTSKASSNSTATSATQQDSLVKSGGNVSIKTTENDINVIGSQIEADKSITLDAAKNINLMASADTERNNSQNKSSSTSIGVSIGLGKNAGLSLDIAASRGKGNANSDSTAYNNTHVTAGETLAIKSGDNTSLIGANAVAKKVIADIGGNLNIASLQDTAGSNANQSNTGVSIGIPIGMGAARGGISQSKQNSNSNYASVNEQSGIQAGDGGFQVNVNGNTDLKGSTITGSSDASKNTLSTQTLTTSDISNSMSASAESSGFSASTNMLQGKYAMAKALAGNALNNGSASQSDASTTTSAISAAQVTVGNKTTDTSKAPLTDSNGKAVNTDTNNTNRTLVKADMQALQKAAQEQQASNMLVLNAATALTDEAYRTMYRAGGTMYKVPPGCSDKSCAVALTEQEAKDLKASQDGKLHISNNGIFNDLDGAVKYAQQNGGIMNEDGSKNYSDKPTNQYIIFAPQANNVLSELIIAAVQKSGATPYVGLTNAEEQTAKIVQQAAQQGQSVVIDSHSRGTLTTDNALQSINNQGGITNEAGNTVKPNIQMNNYGGAQNNETGNQTLQQVTGNENAQINSVVHPRDLIGKTPAILGGNKTDETYTNVSADGTKSVVTAKTDEERGPIANLLNTLFGTASPHNCYGTAGDDCRNQWGNMPESNSPKVTNPDYKAPVVIPQYQQVDKLAPQVQQSSNEQMNQLLQSPSSITTQTTPSSQSNDKLETLKNFKQEQ